MISRNDEFLLLAENAAEAGLPWNGPPEVYRVVVESEGHTVNALVWGEGPPELSVWMAAVLDRPSPSRVVTALAPGIREAIPPS